MQLSLTYTSFVTSVLKSEIKIIYEAHKQVSEQNGNANHVVFSKIWSGRVTQSVALLAQEIEVPGSIAGLATYFLFSFRLFKKRSCQLLAKLCAQSTVYRLGGLGLHRKSVARSTDCPDMTIAVYHGRKTTKQQQFSKVCLKLKVKR